MSAALENTWKYHKRWSVAADKIKASISRWRLFVVLFTVLGAVVETIASQFTTWSNMVWISQVLAILGAVLLGLATFVGRQKLTSLRQHQWLRARSLSEGLKKEIYFYLTSLPPYIGNDADQILLDRTNKLCDLGKDLEGELAGIPDPVEQPPAFPMDMDHYIKERIDDQIHCFYRLRADQLGRKLRIIRNLEFSMGVLAVFLSALGTIYTTITTPWVAVCTSIVIALASHAAANRLEYLVISYLKTARRLEYFKARWESEKQPNEEKRRAFIQDCEDVISYENQGWMAEFDQTERDQREIGNHDICLKNSP